MSAMPRPALIYMGGKFRIAEWIISHFPPHERYLEPFGGAASVLLNKPRAPIECYNDLDKRIYTVFKVMQDKEMAQELEYNLRYTPYSREEFDRAFEDTECADIVEAARKTIIRSFMSVGSGGATRKGKAGFGLKLNKDVIASVNAWPNYPDCLPIFFERLQGVILENKDALKLIEYFDSPQTLFYVDPPYMPETWYSKSNYAITAKAEYHKKLIDLLCNVKGMVVLSGYDNALYRQELRGWHCDSKETKNMLNNTRTECLWLNPAVQERSQKQLKLI